MSDRSSEAKMCGFRMENVWIENAYFHKLTHQNALCVYKSVNEREKI